MVSGRFLSRGSAKHLSLPVRSRSSSRVGLRWGRCSSPAQAGPARVASATRSPRPRSPPPRCSRNVLPCAYLLSIRRPRSSSTSGALGAAAGSLEGPAPKGHSRRPPIARFSSSSGTSQRAPSPSSLRGIASGSSMVMRGIQPRDHSSRSGFRCAQNVGYSSILDMVAGDSVRSLDPREIRASRGPSQSTQSDAAHSSEW